MRVDFVRLSSGDIDDLLLQLVVDRLCWRGSFATLINCLIPFANLARLENGNYQMALNVVSVASVPEDRLRCLGWVD